MIEQDLLRLIDDEEEESCVCEQNVPEASWISEMIERYEFRMCLDRQKLGRIWFGTQKWDSIPQWKKDMVRDHNRRVPVLLQELLEKKPPVKIRLSEYQYKHLTKEEKRKVDRHNDSVRDQWRR